MQGHVFISYVREDAKDVDRLQRVLERAGISVWRDTTNISPGQDWRMAIRGAITQGALVFIACFSDTSSARERTPQWEEIRLAVDEYRQRRPDRPWLIPVRFSDCELPPIDLGAGKTLQSLNSLDLFGEEWEDGCARLVGEIHRLLTAQKDPPPPPPRPRRWLLSALAGLFVVALVVGAVLVRDATDAQQTQSDASSQRRDEGPNGSDREVDTSRSTTSRTSSSTTTATTTPTTPPTTVATAPIPSSVVPQPPTPTWCEGFQSRTTPPVQIAVSPDPATVEPGQTSVELHVCGRRLPAGTHHWITVDCDGDARGDRPAIGDFLRDPNGNFDITVVVRDSDLPAKCPPLGSMTSLTLIAAYWDTNGDTVVADLDTIQVMH